MITCTNKKIYIFTDNYLDNQRSQYLIVMDDDEMDDLETNYNSYKNLKAVFLNQDVLLSTSQERMLQNVDTFIIPDYYFDFELREAGELW